MNYKFFFLAVDIIVLNSSLINYGDRNYYNTVILFSKIITLLFLFMPKFMSIGYPFKNILKFFSI